MSSYLLGTNVVPSFNSKKQFHFSSDYIQLVRTELQEYLLLLFTIYDGNLQVIQQILKKDSISIKQSESIFKIKYKDLLIDFSYIWQRSCRGDTFKIEKQTIYSAKTNSISVIVPNDQIITLEPICLAPIKFFNVSEFNKIYGFSFESLFSIASDKITASFKHDGSCILVYADSDKIIHCDTLGSFGQTTMQKNSLTFKERALQFLSEELKDYLKVHSEIMLFTEMVTKNNIIVTQYNQECLYLLGIYNRFNNAVIEDLFIETQFNNAIVQKFHFKTFDEYLELLNEVKDSNIKKCVEGIVFYYEGYPIAKLKRDEYIQLHKIVSLNYSSTESFKNIDLYYFQCTLDDHMQQFQNQEHFDYIKKLQESTKKLIDFVQFIFENYLVYVSNRKELADKILKETYYNIAVPIEFRKYFFNVIAKQLFVDGNHIFSEESFIQFIKNDLLSFVHQNQKIDLVQYVINLFEKPVVQKVELKKEVKPKKEVDLNKKQNNELVIVIDLDNTMWIPPKKSFGISNWWDSDESISNLFWNEDLVRLIKGYIYVDIPVYFLTGRKRTMANRLHELLKEKLESNLFYLITTPFLSLNGNIHANSVSYKHFVLTLLKNQFDKMIVFDDDVQVLKYAAHKLNVPTISCLSNKFNFYSSINGINSKPILIGLIGPPGSNKSEVSNHCETLLKENQVSYDIVFDSEALLEAIFKSPKIIILRFDLTQFIKYPLINLKDYICDFKIFSYCPINNSNNIAIEYKAWCLHNLIYKYGLSSEEAISQIDNISSSIIRTMSKVSDHIIHLNNDLSVSNNKSSLKILTQTKIRQMHEQVENTIVKPENIAQQIIIEHLLPLLQQQNNDVIVPQIDNNSTVHRTLVISKGQIYKVNQNIFVPIQKNSFDEIESLGTHQFIPVTYTLDEKDDKSMSYNIHYLVDPPDDQLIQQVDAVELLYY